jgi:hypothetical protein
VLIVVVALAAGRAWAADANAAPPAAPGTGATEAECTAACSDLIARCTSVFGASMGDMRPFCTRAVVRRCQGLGVRVCEESGGAP